MIPAWGISYKETVLSQAPYIPGQRWVSNSESEAGLGIVVEFEARRVVISYPAIGEQRTYAVGNAPLSRVIYNLGDRIRNDEGAYFTVLEVTDFDGYLNYTAIDANGETAEIGEMELDSFVQFSKPQDRLFAGQIDKIGRFRLRVETLGHMRRHQQTNAMGLLGARVQLLPHQLYIASEVSSRHAPRVLLADEVGLGKTIEAGLVLHQQLVSGSANRALVVVPDSLVHQWLVEMLRRFNLKFTILDEARCEMLTAPYVSEFDDQADDVEFDEPIDNPFETAQLVLCSLSFLTNNPDRQIQAREAGWDLMIVDEAHHLGWSEQKVSVEYQCIEELSRHIRGLLLLTATPEQLGVESHFARLRLLDPDRYYDLAKFKDEEGSYQQVSSLVEQLQADDAREQLRSSKELHAELEHYLGAVKAAELQTELDSDDLDAAIEDVIRSLLDRHGTGRVLFRNTRDAVTGFPSRELHEYPLPTPQELESKLTGASIEQQLQPELLLGGAWIAQDPRVTWLADWLKGNRNEKVLVICHSAETAMDLESHLNMRCGARSAVFHEGLSLIERDRAAAYFADEEDFAQVLVCSEIGSEGRNFQFSRHLVLFDLPLNPDLLEQRIGRLDRIGQRHNVQIHVPHYDSGAQHKLLHWYHQGLNALERVCPVGSTIYGQLKDRLLQGLKGDVDDAQFTELIAEANQLAETALAEFQQGRDRLLELSSCNPVKAEEIVHDVDCSERSIELMEYMGRVFDHYGVNQQHHSDEAVILEPGDHMQEEMFPELPEDGMTATFDRDKALSREDMHFLSWEHPMVSGAMEMITGNDFGNTTLCTIKLPPLKPGTLLLEAIFIVHCAAPKQVQMHRHLPLTTIRVVVASGGKDLSKVLTPNHFNKLGKKVGRGTAQELVKAARTQILELVKKAETIAELDYKPIVDDAIARMEKSQSFEIQRLTALAEVNPNIRQDEIEYLATVTDSLHSYLGSASLKLDAIRVALVTG